MTDAELNKALHECLGSADRMVNAFGNGADYCHDPAWCVAMMEKHGLHVGPVDMPEPQEWYARKWTERFTIEVEARDKSITRAVALAVLALHREEE